MINDEFQLRLEEIYHIYPRRMGKAQGMQRARKHCRTPEKLAELEKAVRNYKAYVERTKLEPKFIKYFGTFMNEHWKDWLDPNHGSGDHSVLDLDLSGVGFEPEEEK